ncbi:unnamed protein product, partial [Phaeothamnion confervicola]
MDKTPRAVMVPAGDSASTALAPPVTSAQTGAQSRAPTIRDTRLGAAAGALRGDGRACRVHGAVERATAPQAGIAEPCGLLGDYSRMSGLAGAINAAATAAAAAIAAILQKPAKSRQDACAAHGLEGGNSRGADILAA